MAQETNVDTATQSKPARFNPQYLRQSAVKKLIRESGKQCSAEFLMVLDYYVGKKVREACGVHDGGAKRLNATVAGHVGIR